MLKRGKLQSSLDLDGNIISKLSVSFLDIAVTRHDDFELFSLIDSYCALIIKDGIGPRLIRRVNFYQIGCLLIGEVSS
jgi:hypothetical protein